SNDAKEGEDYDARLEMPGWDQPHFDASAWHAVRVTQGNGARVSASNSVPMVEKETFTPTVLTTPDGSTVLDFRQNIAGYISFKVQGKAGHTVKLIHGESLDENGNFTIAHLNMNFHGGPTRRFQELHYTLNGNGTESYKTKFSVAGFRYVHLIDWPCEAKPEDFTAYALYSDNAQTATFHCSDPDIDQLFQNTLWSQKGNFLDVPTDCPTRERAGWTGDGQIFVRTGTYLMDTAAFFKKWLKDMAVLQRPDGKIHNQIPATSDPDDPNHMDSRTAGSAGWGDAAVIIPWTMWKMTGDLRFLEENWDMMQKWVDYEIRHAKETNPNRPPIENPYAEYTWDTCFHFGEWFEADADDKRPNLRDAHILGQPEVATAYFAYSAGLLAECAQALGKTVEAERYAHVSEMAMKAYQFLFAPDGKIDSHHQANFVRPLALGLLTEEQAQVVAQDLVELIASRDYHLGTGFLSTKFLCKVLEEHGYLDVAYKLLEQRTMPSWLYSVTKGATTIWEVWHGIDENNVPHNSHNHYSYGAVVSWLIESVAGIKLDEESPGFKHFFLEPLPGGSLTHTKATYESPYGEIASAWKLEHGIFVYDVKVPPNTTATVILPDGSEPRKIGSGAYHYETNL
ncbi:MAG: family 78 glycoside hydrolase catalytic domain, partial [Anaerolineae bacterium]|nr:family 78 glycoside hydrolase catalytic domain [Anaerolineae bacterium]